MRLITSMSTHCFIDDLFADYLRGQIGGGCTIRAKRALQDVCDLYARGQHLHPLICPDIEISTVGQLEANMMEQKVRRWCLNVLALIGTKERSKTAIERVIERYHNDPDTMASALKAYFKVEPNAYQELSARSFLSAEQIVLAGHIGGFGLRVKSDTTTINVDREGAPILRSALIAVGLQKAPENLFDPRYSNAELVRELSKHDDVSVAQYAVWAIKEHPKLGVSHLGFEPSDVITLPDDVRGWTYRLYGEAAVSDADRHEVIHEGSIDGSGNVRLNLARGLRKTAYDGIEEIIEPWFHDEAREDVREELANHLVFNCEKVAGYQEIAMNAYIGYPARGAQARRLQVSAKGTELYARFRKFELEAEGDLFGSMLSDFEKEAGGVTNNYNIGSIQGGAISLGGDASQKGGTENKLDGDQTVQLKKELTALRDELRQLPNQTDELRDITALVDAAAEKPDPSRLKTMKNGLSALMSGTSSLTKFGGDATKLIGMVDTVLSMLP